MTPLRRIKAILGGSAGNLVEWYDWFAYSSFTLYFAKHFFPKGDQTAQLLQAAAVFAVGFLARPIGAWLMGLYADRKGRRTALATAVALMCLGSFAIAILPDYDAIGALAPAGLLIARLVQGLSLGGEYGASATYMSEMASRKHRGFWSSFQYVTLVGGQLLALAVLIALQHLLSKAALEDWGWRIPFVIGGLLAVVVFWIQMGLEETGSFKAADPTKRAANNPGHLRLIGLLLALALAICAALYLSGNPNWMSLSVAVLVAWELSLVIPLMRDHRREVLVVFGLTAAGSLAFYGYTTYMQKFLVNTTGFTKDQATGITAAALTLYMLVNPLVGWISDHVGRRNVMIASMALGALAAYPGMTAIAGAASPLVAFAVLVGLLVILSGYTAINAVVKSELFPVHVRALAVSLPYALANTTFGGTAEYVALWFKQSGRESGFFIYIAVILALAFLAALMLPDTNKTSLITDD